MTFKVRLAVAATLALSGLVTAGSAFGGRTHID